MKTKKFIKKVSRYLVLSKEFEQKESDLFEDRAVEASSTCSGYHFNGSYNLSISDSLQNITTEAKTRAEVILEKAQSEADRSNRYDEYLKLRETISKYIVSFKL